MVSSPTLQIASITGYVAVNGTQPTREQELKNGDLISIGQGGECIVTVDGKRCLRVWSGKVPMLDLNWPPCLSTHTNCCQKKNQYEVFTPAGSLNVAKEFAATAA